MIKRSGFYLIPITYQSTARRGEVLVREELRLTRPNRHSKVISPNADILGVLLRLTGVQLNFVGGDFGVRVEEWKPEYGKSASLFGLMRAIALLAEVKPDCYEFLMWAAKLFSYHPDEKLKIPPLILPQYYPTTVAGRVKAELEKRGMSWEDYCRGVIKTFRDLSVYHNGREVSPLKVVGLFSENEKEDSTAVQEVVFSTDKLNLDGDTNAPKLRISLFDEEDEE